MAQFQYTYAWWDKARPKALKSTGLGKALKAYETARATFLSKPFTYNYTAARKALSAVEKLRAAAIKECGVLFPGTKKDLQAGVKESIEIAVLNNKLENALMLELQEADREVASLTDSLQSRIDYATTMLDKLKKKTATPEEKKKIDKLVNSESNALIPGTSDLGSEFIAVRNGKAFYKKEIPAVVTLYEAITTTKIPAFTALRGEYMDVFNELTVAFNGK